jgi:hypothetical protein
MPFPAIALAVLIVVGCIMGAVIAHGIKLSRRSDA